MKKLITILVLFFICKTSFGQSIPIGSAYPVPQALGNTPSTLVTTNTLRAVQGVIPGYFSDTTSANLLPYLKHYPGAVIFCSSTNSLWLRNTTATLWIEVGSGGGGSVNIYNSDGTLTANRTVQLSTFLLNFDRGVNKQLELHDTYSKLYSPNNLKIFSLYDDSVTLVGVGQSASSSDSVLVRTASGNILTRAQSAVTGVNIYNSDGTIPDNRTVEIDTGKYLFFNARGANGGISLDHFTDTTESQIYTDDFSTGIYRRYNGTNVIGEAGVFMNRQPNTEDLPRLELYGDGGIFIDTLNATTDTTGKSLVIRNLTTGLLENIAPALIGGGSSGITIGTTTVTSGTPTKVLYNNSGVVGEYTVSGSGNVAMTTSPTFTTPILGTPTSATLTNATGYLWNNIANPTGAQALTIGAGNGSTWTDQQTTGTNLSITNSTLTSGGLIGLTSTSTAANNFSLLNINSSGANANSTRTARGAVISVTNTGTASTNTALTLTASGGTTNNALIATAGNVGIGTSTPAATRFETNGTTGSSVIMVVADGVKNFLGAADNTPAGGEHYLSYSYSSNFGILEASHPASGNFVIRNVGAGGFYLQSAAAQPVILYAASTQILTATSAGVGVGTSATSPNSTLQVGGSFSGAYVAKTGSYTLTAADFTVSNTSGSNTMTLPTAVGITGRIYYIVNTDAGATVTVATTSSQTFVNFTATPTTLTKVGLGTFAFQSNGANWMVLSNY